MIYHYFLMSLDMIYLYTVHNNIEEDTRTSLAHHRSKPAVTVTLTPIALIARLTAPD